MRVPLLAAAVALSALLTSGMAGAQSVPITPPPLPSSDPANVALQRTFTTLQQTQMVNPSAAAAANFQYQEALARYRNGDLVGAQNAATRAQAIAGSAPLFPAPLQPYPPIPAYPVAPPQLVTPATPLPSYAPPSIPAQPLLAEDPLDALLALVQRDIQVAKTHADVRPAQAAYQNALARRRAGDEAGATREANRALDLVRGEMQAPSR